MAHHPTRNMISPPLAVLCPSPSPLYTPPPVLPRRTLQMPVASAEVAPLSPPPLTPSRALAVGMVTPGLLSLTQIIQPPAFSSVQPPLRTLRAVRSCCSARAMLVAAGDLRPCACSYVVARVVVVGMLPNPDRASNLGASFVNLCVVSVGRRCSESQRPGSCLLSVSSPSPALPTSPHPPLCWCPAFTVSRRRRRRALLSWRCDASALPDVCRCATAVHGGHEIKRNSRERGSARGNSRGRPAAARIASPPPLPTLCAANPHRVAQWMDSCDRSRGVVGGRGGGGRSPAPQHRPFALASSLELTRCTCVFVSYSPPPDSNTRPMGNTQRATTPRPTTPTVLAGAALAPELVVTVSTSASDCTPISAKEGSWASPPPLHSPPGLLRPTSAPPGASPRRLKPHLRPSPASAATSTRDQTRSPSSSRVSASTTSASGGLTSSFFDSPPLHPRTAPHTHHPPLARQHSPLPQTPLALCANCQRMAIPVQCIPQPMLTSPATTMAMTLHLNSLSVGAGGARSDRSRSRTGTGGGGGLHRSRSVSGSSGCGSTGTATTQHTLSFCSKDCHFSWSVRLGLDDEHGDDPFHAAAAAAAKARGAQQAPPDSYVENRREQIRRRAHSGSSNNLSLVGGAAHAHSSRGHDSPRSTSSAQTTPRLAPGAGSHPSHTTTATTGAACDDPSCQSSHHPDALTSPCSYLHLGDLCVEEFEEELDQTSPSAVRAIPKAKPLEKLKPFAMPLLELPLQAPQQHAQPTQQSPQPQQPPQQRTLSTDEENAAHVA